MLVNNIDYNNLIKEAYDRSSSYKETDEKRAFLLYFLESLFAEDKLVDLEAEAEEGLFNNSSFSAQEEIIRKIVLSNLVNQNDGLYDQLFDSQ